MSRSFTNFLIDYQSGVCHAELSAKLDELLKAVRETGKVGSMTLTLKIKPAARSGDVDKVMIDDTITAKLPKHDRGSDFFWLTEDAEPVRNHPKQQGFEFREVPTEAPQSLRQV